jgi:hypothetical protein
MHEIRVDQDKNRLFIRLAGRISRQEAEQVLDRMVFEIGRLKEGFAVINDISEFRLGDLGAVGVLRDTVNYLAGHGVGRVIRVVGGSRIGLVQFARATPILNKYKVTTVPTIRDAESLLEQKDQPPAANA